MPLVKGKKAKNSHSQFNALFEVDEDDSVDGDDIDLDETKLDELEKQWLINYNTVYIT